MGDFTKTTINNKRVAVHNLPPEQVKRPIQEAEGMCGCVSARYANSLTNVEKSVGKKCQRLFLSLSMYAFVCTCVCVFVSLYAQQFDQKCWLLNGVCMCVCMHTRAVAVYMFFKSTTSILYTLCRNTN